MWVETGWLVVRVVRIVRKKGANGSRPLQDCEKSMIMIHRLHHLHYPCLLLLLAAPFVSPGSCPGGGSCDDNTVCCPGTTRGWMGSHPPCPLCAQGLFQNHCTQQHSTTCKTCPAGFKVKSDMTDCISCSGGQYNSQNGQKPAVCGNCPSGQCAKTVTGPCATCNPPFVYTAETYHCSGCDQGQAMATGDTKCSTCNVGRYQDESASSIWGGGYNTFYCKMCPAGTQGTTAGAKSRNDCHSCLAGKYGTENGATSCHQCPTGYTNTAPGSTNCTKASVDPGCAQGKYSPEAGTIKSSQCVDCPTGTFSAKSDQVHSCAGTCSAGKFSSETGIISDSQCKGQCSAGRWSSETGRSSDDQCGGRCSSGKYSAEIGLSSDE